MNKLILLLSVVTCFCDFSYSQQNKNGHNKSKNNGNKWESLFDGKTTNGWHTYGKGITGRMWKVENGTLHLDASLIKTYKDEDGDLVSNEEFENFDLKLDWKISKNGNSGIMIYVNEDASKYKTPYMTGPEIQVLDNEGHPDAKIIKHRAGDLYDLISSSKETVKPFGEWNHAEIVANNGKLDIYLNGEHSVSTTMWDENWRKMIANSKFKSMPDFGTFHKGHIDLQDHGNEVWFKNIQIRRL